MISIGNTFILGDSYSTFEGYIPKGYKPYYTTEEKETTDVNKVNHTWWHQLLKETESNLLRNCSYSGTTICNTGYDGQDCSDISFIARFEKLVQQNYFKENKIDTFFLYGGTNDSWADSPIGDLKYSDWKKEDLFFVLPAFCYLIHRICEVLPEARIICVVNSDLKHVIIKSYKEVCEKYNVEYVEINGIDKKGGHPSIKGMTQIKEQIMACM